MMKNKAIALIVISFFLFGSNILFSQTNTEDASGGTPLKGSEGKETAELFITSDPEDAKIAINGIFKGYSPLLVGDVPLGYVRIEANKEGMFGFQDLELTERGFFKVDIVLHRQFGRIFVKTDERNLLVSIDGAEPGSLGNGLLEEIPEGEHLLILHGNGLYAEMVVAVNPAETVEVYPELIPVGALHYRLPSGSTATIMGKDYLLTLEGEDVIERIPPGQYKIETSHPDFLKDLREVEIERGKTCLYFPILVHSDEYKKKIDREAKSQEYEELVVKKRAMTQELMEERDRHKKLTAAGRVFYFISGAFAMTSGTSAFIAYLSSIDNSSRRTWGGISLGFGIGASMSVVVGSMCLLERPNIEEMQDNLQLIETDIEHFFD